MEKGVIVTLRLTRETHVRSEREKKTNHKKQFPNLTAKSKEQSKSVIKETK